MKRIILVMAAIMSCLVVSSCSEEEPIPDYGVALMNKRYCYFSQEGGIDTLYCLNDNGCKMVDILFADSSTYQPVLQTNMNKRDTAFFTEDSIAVGKIAYKEGIFNSMDTEWYSIYRDEKATDVRYIIKAHPVECPYKMVLYFSIKHGSGIVDVIRDSTLQKD